MKTPSRITFFSLAVILLLSGCSKVNIIDIKKTNFTDQIDQFQNLEFTFSQDIAPDSLIQKWDSTAFITFDPPVRGRFKWTGQRDLTFSPTGPFAPNTDYKATLTSEILKLSTIEYTFKEPVIRFHTPYLELKGCYSFWALGENESDIEIHIMIGFNYPVDVQDVKKFIRLTASKKNLPYRIVPGESNTEFQLAVAAPADETLTSIYVVMGAGMKAIGSPTTVTRPVTFEVAVPPNDKLEITDVSTDFVDGMGIITVTTSQPVVMKGLKSLVSVDPQAEYEIIPSTSGFSLKGEFGDGETFSLTLRKGIKGVFGPQLEDDRVESVTFGALDPYIAFADEAGMYLTPGGQGNLGLRIINTPKVEITVFRIFENNIQHYMRYGQYYDYEWYDDEEGGYSTRNYRIDENFGKVISTKVYSTDAFPKKGNLRLLKINSNDLEISDERKGIYLIQAKSVEKQWLRDLQLLSYSDIGLIVKKGVDEIFVATRSIATAEPIEGVTISLYSSNNQVMHKMVTGRDGVVVLKDLEKTIPGFRVSMVTARKGEDFNVLLLDNSAVELTRFETGGKYTSGRQYDAFIYGERNLFRPGDSARFNVILRDFSMKTVTGFPVKMRIIGPDGKDFLKRRINISPTGSAELSIFLPEKSYTGGYTLEVLTVNDILINSYHFKVEEFMPDRISVDVKSDKKDYNPGDKMKVTITAMNLFGPPAANRKVENELRITRKDFFPKEYAGKYNFSLSTKENLSVMSVVNQTVTSDKGIAHQEFALPAFTNAGIFNGKVYSTVFDETGRPVNRRLDFNIYTQKTFLGVSHIPYWLSSGKPVNIHMIALNEKEKPVSAKAKLEVVLSVWETVIERNYGQNRYRSQEKQRVVLSRDINIEPGGTKYTYIPDQSGTYKIRLSMPNSSSYVEQSFYSYRWGGSDESTFRINKDGQIDITFDKEAYEPGQTAKILFKTPFPGEMLVTVEQDKVIEYHTVHADNNGAVLNLDIKDEFLPNAYITATLLRKAVEGGIPLTVAHGFNSMKVEKKSNRIAVLVSAPEQIRSGVKQKISAKTSPGAEVTIAVVDEGILQITDYKTPDPYEYFYAKRALEVEAYDLFDELFPELSTKATGGDQGFDLGKRLNPLTAKRVKLLSLWSGRQTANANGDVEFTADIPKFSGAVRIMAVAHKNNQFGAGEKRMRIADPVTISSSLPRFMSPSDQSIVFVTLSNTTAKPIDVNLSVSANQPLTAGKIDKSKLTIPANSEVRVSYTLTAAYAMGVSSVTFKAASRDETFAEKVEMSVRPAVPLVKESSSGTIEAGKTITVKAPANFEKTGSLTRLIVTDNPAAKFINHLDYLINYPYGCIEQTISAAFPQLYFKDLAELLKKNTAKNSAQVNTNVNEAIRKIVAYQQYNGGVITWPTYSEINWWNSAYAAHFLYEAERAGYTVDKNVVEKLNKYLLEMTKQKGTTEYFYYDDDNRTTTSRVTAKREIFYSLFVLALHGKHHLPTMNYYKARPELLSDDSKYLLAAAYRLTGDIKSYNAIVPKDVYFEKSAVMTGESYASPVRDKAIALYTLVTADPDNPKIALLAKEVSDMVSNHQWWYSTQERVFAFLALGKMAKNLNQGNINATITVNGKATQYKDKSMAFDLGTGQATISTSGKGYLFWYSETEGLPVSMTVKETDKVLRVRRVLFSRNGNPLSSTTFKQNDLIVVALYISTNDGSMVDNVVVTDILPACFEVENSRLTSEREMEWIKQEDTPQYKDIRDDRINFFTSASSRQKVFYYMVRVVNKGTFTQGPVGAEAMYNGQYFSYFGAQKIKVE